MKGVFFILIFLLPFSLASCSESQIDLNSASMTELDKLSGIGPIYAQRIIDSRPYSSIDDLIAVKGIGPAILEKIKSQGMACVSSGVSSRISVLDESSSIVVSNSYQKTSRAQSSIQEEIPAKDLTENIINLNSGETLSDNTQEEIIFESKNEKVKRYLIFVFAFFLILIIILLLLTG